MAKLKNINLNELVKSSNKSDLVNEILVEEESSFRPDIAKKKKLGSLRNEMFFERQIPNRFSKFSLADKQSTYNNYKMNHSTKII